VKNQILPKIVAENQILPKVGIQKLNKLLKSEILLKVVAESCLLKPILF